MKKSSLISIAVAASATALVLAGCSGSSGDGGGGDTAARACIILPDSASSPRWESGDRPALEAAFTALLAWRLYGEAIDRRVGTAMALLLAGGLLLIVDRSDGGLTQAWGLTAVMVATAAWGVDNALSRALAERDPSQVVLAKASLGVMATVTATT